MKETTTTQETFATADTQKNPLITIVTVCFNPIKAGRKASLCQCIESVRAQTYPHIEHLIIDGASTDGTVELLESLGVKYISEPDSGIYDAMNKGIRLAAGEYILFLNSDDFFHNAEGMAQSIAALRRTGAAFSCAPAVLRNEVDGTERILTVRLHEYLYRVPFCHQTMLCRRDVFFQEGLFDTTFKSAGDYDFAIRLLLKGYDVVELESAFVTFRTGGEAETNIELSEYETVGSFIKNYSPYVKKSRSFWHHCFYKNKIIPRELLPFIPAWEHEKIIKHSRRQYRRECWRALRRSIIFFRIRKEKRLRIFGIDLINRKKYKQ